MTLFKRGFWLQIITLVFCLFLNSCSSLALENELFDSLQEKCNIQKECTINLHKITSFEWDRAYFFQKNNKNYIQKITKTSYDFQTDVGIQVIFIKNNKVVAYQEFFTINDLNPSWNIKRKYIDITFVVKNKFGGNNKYINYYYITPSNDKLMVQFNLAYSKNVVQKSYTIYPTNLNQIKLFNPQTDNN